MATKSGLAAVLLAAWASVSVLVTPVFPDEVDAAVARAKRMVEAGETSEATAVLARAFSQRRDPALLKAWLEIDGRRIEGLESQLHHATLPDLPQLKDVGSLQRALAAFIPGWQELCLTGVYLFLDVVFLPQKIKDANNRLTDFRASLEKQRPPPVSEAEVNDRLDSIDECWRSMKSSMAAISLALQTSPEKRNRDAVGSEGGYTLLREAITEVTVGFRLV